MEIADTPLDFLTATPDERNWPNLAPKDSASLIIIDSEGDEVKVLMGRRHPGHIFMPGMVVFPGGRVEDSDRRMPAAGMLHPRVESALNARVSRPSPLGGRALALAAIRETFEETGILIGTRERYPAKRIPAGAWSEFCKHGVLPDLGAMALVARAITPPCLRRRFDTRFFAVYRGSIAVELQDVIGADSELVELVWVTISDARQLELAKMTQIILTDLQERLDRGFSHDLPVPFYFERRGRLFRAQL